MKYKNKNSLLEKPGELLWGKRPDCEDQGG
jgi:hypothetical protein